MGNRNVFDNDHPDGSAGVFLYQKRLSTFQASASGSRKNLPNSFGNSGIPDGFDGAALVPWNRELRLG